ncbi:MAG: cyclic nucleotide-binding domain-containing protein [Methyloligellaceae bacterium]
MPTIDDHKKLLNETNIFAGVRDGTLDRIVEIAREQKCAGDEVLYDTGDDTVDVYVLLSGSVRFSLANKTGILSSGTLIKSQMIFGWAALVPEHPRRLGSARCMEPSTLLVMNGGKVLEALRDDPESGFKVMERLCGMIARSFMEQRN